MKKYLITGGAGFIGAHLVKNLLDESNHVSVIDNFYRSVPERIKVFEENPNFKIFNRDIKNLNDIKPLFGDVDCVFHLAAINGTENFYKIPVEILDVGIYGIRNVLESADFHKVKNVIVASSAEVYQTPIEIPTKEDTRLTIPDIKNPRFSYGLSKIVTESYSMNYDFKYDTKVKIFRPHNIYGPDMGFKHVIPQFISTLIKMKKDKMSSFVSKGSLEATRAFCFISDLIEGLRILEETDTTKEIFHIGTNEEIKIEKLIDTLSSILSVSVRSKTTLDSHIGGTSRRCPDITKMKLLGYSPKTSILEGLEKTCDWYLSAQKSSNEFL